MWVGRWYATAFLSRGFRIAVDPAIVGGIERRPGTEAQWVSAQRFRKTLRLR